MTMRFFYKRFPVPHPIPSLGGMTVRSQPLVIVSLIGPKGTYIESGRLDTAADDTVFPEDVVAKLGIDLSQAPIRQAAGVGLVASAIRYAQVTIRIADQNEQREWISWVGFTSTPLRRPLLGIAGFLQFFTATFHGDREEVELTINAAYPGRQTPSSPRS